MALKGEIGIMMAGLFLLFVITMLFAWFGMRRVSLYLFIITLMFCVYWFLHHATETLKINL